MFNSLEENIEAVKLAEAAEAELVLLGYPPYFYPKSLEDVYAYTKAFCDATNLAVMLFPVPTWGFSGEETPMRGMWSAYRDLMLRREPVPRAA
ncbi:hypothetical protein [Burkholderia orbicola]|uniref:hypothetical protein n=1 Tax=Burkholderia orbicola TaxID=2978683 RepID=UPI0039A44322